MGNMRAAMDSTFWDMNISSPQTLNGSARLVPDESIPLVGSRASRVHRAHQLSLLGNGFPFGLVPSYSPNSHGEDLGSYTLDSILLTATAPNWWLGLIGRVRPKKLISAVRQNGFHFPKFKDVKKHCFDKSLYALGLRTELSLGPASSLILSTEGDGERTGRHSKAMFLHKLPEHDITLEAAWPELFIDRNGRYWDVPGTISLDMSSLISESGLRYRFGVHRNSGHPLAVNATNGDPPLALMPGLCAKASFSYEKNKDFWRRKQKKEDIRIKRVKGPFAGPYDKQLKEPHASVSGIVGGTCTAWFGGKGSSAVPNSATAAEGTVVASNTSHRNPLNVDLFGSVCSTFQLGKFEKRYVDLTRVDARLDICSVSAFARGAAHLVSNVFRSSPTESKANPLDFPRLNVILQQQVFGPIIFRVDSKLCLDSTPERKGLQCEDVIYSLTYSLRLLQSGKVVAWYSPKRKEGMVELRLFEF